MKKRVVVFVIVALLITNLFTGLVTHYTTLLMVGDISNQQTVAVSNNKVKSGQILISKEEYETFKSLEAINSKIAELENFILKNYYKEFDRKDFEDGILKGIFMALGDPYSVYMNDEEFSRFIEDTKGTYSGVGIIVAPKKDGMVTVVSPIEDTPAERAGIRAGDKILKVNDFDVTADVMDEAVRQMRGKAGESVNITIYRPSDKRTLEIPIVREDIRLKTVKSRMIDDIAYIRISTFDSLTSEDFEKQLNELLSKNPKGLVVDLRNNPGGSVAEVVKIADRLLPKQMIVYTEDRDGKKHEYKSGFLSVDMPMAVIANGGSASASEILAGAIQDTGEGVIVGEQTFGKGVVQTVFPLDDNSGFKLTTSEYFTPNGRNIHGIGITPDYVVEMPKEYYDIKNPTDDDDIQLLKAIDVLHEEIKKGN